GPTGRHHDVAGLPSLRAGDDRERVTFPGDGADRCLFEDRRREGSGIGLEPGGELGHRHETVRIRSGGGAPWQAAHPVGREQPQRVPALAARPLRDATAFDDDMVVSERREVPADGEARLAGADDDRVDRRHGGQTVVTSIVTGTWLVMTSKTAERARDWA